MEGQFEETKFKMTRQRQYLRTLKFGFIRDIYNKSMSNSSSKRKVQIAMYAIPAAISFGIAFSNYLQQSFGIYLKYQALVDSYYIQKKGT